MTNYNERLDEILLHLQRTASELSIAKGLTYKQVSQRRKYQRTRAKQAITSLIKELVEEARIDELSQLLDEGEGGYPDGCEAVHLHSIEDRIAQLTQSNKEATQ